MVDHADVSLDRTPGTMGYVRQDDSHTSGYLDVRRIFLERGSNQEKHRRVRATKLAEYTVFGVYFVEKIGTSGSVSVRNQVAGGFPIYPSISKNQFEQMSFSAVPPGLTCRRLPGRSRKRCSSRTELDGCSYSAKVRLLDCAG
jgi:hypothetical protein